MKRTRARTKRRHKENESRSIIDRLGLLLFALAGVALASLTAGTALLTPNCQAEGCPTLATVEAYRPPEPPRVYDMTGRLAGQLSGPRRLVVPLEDVAPVLAEGFVATEDRRFYDHPGVDLLGIARAVVRNLQEGRVSEGASTITMQLVRNVFEADVAEYNRWRRKLTEARMAFALEERLSKDRILELYLNQINLSNGVWGVETAAQHFFGVSAADVTPAQAALIIGLAKNPGGYNPRRHPDRALQRRAVVLDVMERTGVLTPEVAEEARQAPLELSKREESDRGHDYFMAAVDRHLRDIVPDPALRAGARVFTTLEPRLQLTAHQALRRRIEEIEGGAAGRYAHPVTKRPPPAGGSTSTLASVIPDTGPDGNSDVEAEEERPSVSPYLQGMVVSLDPGTGAVRALVGGRDFDQSEFDRATLAMRQPGSAFKPFVYAAALESGATLADQIETDPITVRQVGQADWVPRDGGDGQPLSVRAALEQSSNTAAVRIGLTTGLSRVARTAERMGVSADLPDYPAVLLGAADVVPIDLVAAYAAFGNGGRRIEPYLIERVEAPSGEILWERAPETHEQVISPGVAFLTLDAMRGVVDRGTGRAARAFGYWGPAAGKTGTSDAGRDAWFVGMTPELVTGVWLGFDAPKPIVASASGGSLAAPVWGKIMASREWAAESGGWNRPTEVVHALLDKHSGHLATPYCPDEHLEVEYFLVGTAPIMQCSIHRPNLRHRVLGTLQRILGIRR